MLSFVFVTMVMYEGQFGMVSRIKLNCNLYYKHKIRLFQSIQIFEQSLDNKNHHHLPSLFIAKYIQKQVGQ